MEGQLMNKAKMPKLQTSMPMPKAPKSMPAEGRSQMLQKMVKPMKEPKPIKALPDMVKPLKQKDGSGLRDILKNNFMKWRDTIKDRRLA